MECINEDMSAYMAKVVEEERAKDHDGETATTMQLLGLEDHEMFGIAAVGTDGHVEQGAQATTKFPLESVSKALGLALALEDVGEEVLFKSVAKEPRGDQFNSIAAIEEGEHGLPSNPMINAGAIVCTAHIKAQDGNERFARLLQFMRDLGRIAAVFANGGRCLKTNKQLVSEETVRIVLTLMFTTGMYEGSGSFAVDVGIPAKSGVSGAHLTLSEDILPQMRVA